MESTSKKKKKTGKNAEDAQNALNSEKFKALINENKDPKKKMSKDSFDMKEFPNGKKPSVDTIEVKKPQVVHGFHIE